MHLQGELSKETKAQAVCCFCQNIKQGILYVFTFKAIHTQLLFKGLRIQGSSIKEIQRQSIKCFYLKRQKPLHIIQDTEKHVRVSARVSLLATISKVEKTGSEGWNSTGGPAQQSRSPALCQRTESDGLCWLEGKWPHRFVYLNTQSLTLSLLGKDEEISYRWSCVTGGRLEVLCHSHCVLSLLLVAPDVSAQLFYLHTFTRLSCLQHSGTINHYHNASRPASFYGNVSFIFRLLMPKGGIDPKVYKEQRM